MDATERRAWLEERRSGIGGSDVANILGEGYSTPLDVYLSKIGEVEELDSAPIKRGRALEPVAIDLYRELTGRVVDSSFAGVIRDHHAPMLIASIDSAVFRDGGQRGVLEIKAPGLRSFSQMRDKGIPKAYILQIQHYLGVTGFQFGSFAAFSAERWEMLHFDVERDDELIGNMREMVIKWWNDHVVARRPPEREKYEIPTDAMVPAGEVVMIDTPEFRDAVQRYFEARELSTMAEAMIEATREEIVGMMGGHQVVETVGARFVHKFAKGRSGFDKDLLAAAQPLDRRKVEELLTKFYLTSGHDLIGELDKCILDLSQFTKTGKPSQPFKPYLLKPAMVAAHE